VGAFHAESAKIRPRFALARTSAAVRAHAIVPELARIIA